MNEGVVDGQHQVAARCFVHQPLRLLGSCRHGLFHQDMLARHESAHGQMEMAGYRRCDGHGMDALVAQHLVEVVRHGDRRIACLHGVKALHAPIAHAYQACARRFAEIAHQVRAPVSISDNGNADHVALLSMSAGVPLARMRAGTPATVAWAGTSLVTTAPAPTRAPSPMVMPGRMVALEPMETPSSTTVGTTSQSASVCGSPSPRVARG